VSSVTTIVEPTIAAPIGPYSHATIAGGMLWCTGQLPLDAAGQVVSEEPAAQARQCLENLAAVCAGAGTSLAAAARVTIYMTDLGAFPAVNEVYAELLPHHPARTTIGVAALPMGVAVEIDAIVALPA
jgi:2-iminobutanoate/2-iminopropanoate deaminase